MPGYRPFVFNAVILPHDEYPQLLVCSYRYFAAVSQQRLFLAMCLSRHHQTHPTQWS